MRISSIRWWWIKSTSCPWVYMSLSTLAECQATTHLQERGKKKRNTVTLACEYSNMPDRSNSNPGDCRAHWAPVSRLQHLLICWFAGQVFHVPLEMVANLLQLLDRFVFLLIWGNGSARQQNKSKTELQTVRSSSLHHTHTVIHGKLYRFPRCRHLHNNDCVNDCV